MGPHESWLLRTRMLRVLNRKSAIANRKLKDGFRKHIVRIAAGRIDGKARRGCQLGTQIQSLAGDVWSGVLRDRNDEYRFVAQRPFTIRCRNISREPPAGRRDDRI